MSGLGGWIHATDFPILHFFTLASDRTKSACVMIVRAFAGFAAVVLHCT